MLDVFVETGTAKIVEPGKADSTGADVRSGAFASRSAGKAVVTAERAPSAFVSALPRDFMDALPLRAARFANAREAALDRDATYPEVQSWFTSPYRVAFMKRFEPKLAADPAFKAAAEANAKATPEWNVAKQAPVPPPAPAPAAAAKVEPPKEEKKAAEPDRTWRWPWERASGK
jgi:hypothetical protein